MHEFIGTPPSEARWSFRPLDRALNVFTKTKSDAYAQKNKQEQRVIEPVLPSAVRYALEYKEGQLGFTEILSLVNNNFTDLATYSLLKGLNDEQEQQQDFLESFVDTVIEHPDTASALKTLQQSTLEQIQERSSLHIKGAKIAQISRQGVRLWEEKFEDVAKDIDQMPAEVAPVYIAYAGILGLRQGVKEFSKSGRSMMVMIPDWVHEEDNPYCGYEIDPTKEQGERVKVLEKNFDRPEEFVFIDDTRRNGVHVQVMWDYWTKNSGEDLSESHVRVVNFAPKDARV